MTDDGDHTEAQALFAQRLSIVRDHDNGWMAANALDAFAGLAAVQAQPRRALRLAAAALRETKGFRNNKLADRAR